MSNLSDFLPGGGKLRYQEFTASGTFTPSAKLLANGGQVQVLLVGSGGSGISVPNSGSWDWLRTSPSTSPLRPFRYAT